MSRFKDILDAAKHREAGPAAGTTPAPPPAPPPSPAPAAAAPPPKRGRPPGKKSDPNFVQVSAYIPAELHHNIKLALLQERQGREFSGLVAELLEGWLKLRG